jgi:AcrR family transcriptional regulator
MQKGNRRERERLARKAAILAAAEPILRAKGYDGLVMDDVAAEAEVGKGTVYLYFANKDALCAAIGERHLREEFLPELRERLGAEVSPADRVVTTLRTYVDFFETRPQVFRFILSWLLAEAPAETSSPDFVAYRARLGEVLELVVSAIAAGQRDGSIRRDVPSYVLAMDLWSSFVGLMVTRLTEPALRQRLPVHVPFDELVRFELERTREGLRPRLPKDSPA